MIIDDLELIKTCAACPEQYDVLFGGKKVAYLRLRHGVFSVRMPDVSGREVLCASDMKGDGEFYDDERENYLNSAVQAIRRELS